MNCRLGAAFIALLVMSGCAKQGINTYRMTNNTPVIADNSVVITKPQPQVWDITVKALSKSSYVMRNIDRQSNIITLSFISDSPTGYVDCGKTFRTYSEGSNTETFEYDTAGSATFKVAAAGQEDRRYANYSVVNRGSTLEVNSTVYVGPDEKESKDTIVRVNTRYTLNFTARGENFAKHLNSVISRGKMPGEIAIVAFSSDKPTEHEDIYGDGTKMTCFSKGKAERDILDLIKAELQVSAQKDAEQKVIEQTAIEDQAARKKDSEEQDVENESSVKKDAKQKVIEQIAEEYQAAQKKGSEEQDVEQQGGRQKAVKQKAIEQIATEYQAAEKQDMEQQGSGQKGN